jgi:hypothetical protein
MRKAEMEQHGLSRDEWLEKLALVDDSLRRQGVTAQLTLIGSAAGILAGQPDRTSIDLAVWKPTSRYQFQALKKAVEDAGLLFDPKSTLEPDRPYIQLVEPGITETGKFEATDIYGAIWRIAPGAPTDRQPDCGETRQGRTQRSGGHRLSDFQIQPRPSGY